MGRVWVCEGVNYRQWQKLRPEGDRILVLEDTRRRRPWPTRRVCSTRGPEINAALGICVLGDKVIVSCSPDVYVFTDHGEGKPPTKEAGAHGHCRPAARPRHARVPVWSGRQAVRQLRQRRPAAAWMRDGKPIADREGNQIQANGRPVPPGHGLPLQS
jgi:hypothetical protein